MMKSDEARFLHNSAEYGGGISVRPIMGESSGRIYTDLAANIYRQNYAHGDRNYDNVKLDYDFSNSVVQATCASKCFEGT